jgi:hypothetical protein
MRLKTKNVVARLTNMGSETQDVVARTKLGSETQDATIKIVLRS